MSQWYFADRDRQPQGPVSAVELGTHFRFGRVGLETLVWREGMSEWRRLGDFADELGLLADARSDVAPAAPPLPLPPSPTPAFAPAAPRVPMAPSQGARASYRSAPPKKGMSGGKIALIVAAVLALPCLGVVGVLAAIALPAYNDYTIRAKVSGAIAEGSAIKMVIAEHQATTGACPANGDAGLGEPDSYASTYVTQATIGEFDGGTCGFELQIGNTGDARLDGKKIWFDLDAGTGEWSCTSEIDDPLLPVSCRG